MTFANPQAFWVLLALPVLAFFFLASFKAKAKALERFGSPRLMSQLASSASITKQYIKAGLILGGIFWFIFALARPQFGMVVETIRREGSDIIIALDVSQSMMAQDLQPNRLVKAKSDIQALLSRMEGNRVGLVVFAGSAFLMSPLTTDYRAIELFLRGADVGAVSRQGTNLSQAILTSLDSFDEKVGAFRAIVLITDGEQHEGEAIEAAEKAAKAGVRIFTIGIGTTEGVPIPIGKKGAEGGYKKSGAGEIVLSRLDAATLAEIARLTGGVFHQATRQELELDVVQQEIDGLEKRELYSKEVARYQDQFQVFIALGLLLLLAEWFLSDRRSESREWTGRFE